MAGCRVGTGCVNKQVSPHGKTREVSSTADRGMMTLNYPLLPHQQARTCPSRNQFRATDKRTWGYAVGSGVCFRFVVMSCARTCVVVIRSPIPYSGNPGLEQLLALVSGRPMPLPADSYCKDVSSLGCGAVLWNDTQEYTVTATFWISA